MINKKNKKMLLVGLFTLFSFLASPSIPTQASSLTNDDLWEVQQVLQDQNIYQGSVDGIYGPLTKEALISFQKEYNIPMTGEIDELTSNVIKRISPEISRSYRVLNMVATGYTRYDEGCGNYTYNGNYLKKGLVAVDPSVIPLGTKLYINGYGYAIADDIGGAIKGNKIDLAFESQKEAFEFGRRTVSVRIIN